jgi:hydrogenase large subunit
VAINLGIRILLGSSFYDDGKARRCSSRTIPSATSIVAILGTAHEPQASDFDDKYSWVMSPLVRRHRPPRS